MRKTIALGGVCMIVALVSGYLFACKYTGPERGRGVISGTVTANGAGLQDFAMTLTGTHTHLYMSYSNAGYIRVKKKCRESSFLFIKATPRPNLQID